MVTDPFLVGVFFGFVPSMGFLYVLLREYQSFFSEKRVFRTFLLGLLLGFVATVLEQQLSPAVFTLSQATVSGPAAVGFLAVFAAMLGLLEALIFTALLNWKTFRGRRDTPYYGVAFGLGFGGTNVLYLVATIVRLNEEQFDFVTWADVILLVMLGLFFIGGILVHAAMGAWIGQGTGTGPLPAAVARAGAARGLYVGGFYMLLLTGSAVTSHAIAVAGLAFGVLLTHAVVTRVLDRLVPPEILREMGIHNRRLARRVLRDDAEEGPPR